MPSLNAHQDHGQLLWSLFGSFLLGMNVLVGCGGNGLVPVKGRVLLDDKPIENAAVMFQLSGDGAGVPATAVTNQNGEFSLTTTGIGEGAAPGTHGVTVVKSVNAEPNKKIEEGEIVRMKQETPIKYASSKTSGLTVEVKHGMPLVELKLVSK